MGYGDNDVSHPGFQEKSYNSSDDNNRGYGGQRDSSGHRNYDRGNSWNNGGNRFGGNGFKKDFKKPEPVDPEKVTLYKPYTVTANKEIPEHILERIKNIILELEKKNYVLRTGGMTGPEDTFEKAVSLKEIYLPWRGFDDKESKFTFTSPVAKILASKYQPGFDGLKPAIQAFLTKNVRILCGTDTKSPSLFMIVWTEDGAESLKEKSIKTGNSGHAIAIASEIGIPVFNFGKSDAEDRLRKYLNLNHG